MKSEGRAEISARPQMLWSDVYLINSDSVRA